MLNPFPILFLSQLAHFLLRVIIGITLVFLGINRINIQKKQTRSGKRPHIEFTLYTLAAAEITLGVMFTFGFLTQIAALTTMALAFLCMFRNSERMMFRAHSKTFYVLLFAIALSLFITGAGAFAFDLPI